MDIRKFIYASSDAIIAVVGGVAAYFATTPLEVIKETLVKL